MIAPAAPFRARNAEFGADWERSPLGLMVPPRRARRRYDRPVAIDLFAGAGGFGCGFHQAGYHVAAASEVWITAAVTYMVNLARPGVKIHFDTPEREAEFTADIEAHMGLGPTRRGQRKRSADAEAIGCPSVAGSGWISHQPTGHPGCEQFFLYDIRNLTGETILEALDLDVGDVAVVTGGPPCQGFSAAGKKNVMDPRNSLVFEFARLVCEIQPRTFVMENVVGMASMVTPEGVPVIDAFCLAVSDGGYGEYDALRKAMAGADKGARAALKNHSKPQRPSLDPDPDEDDQEQLDLFGAAS